MIISCPALEMRHIWANFAAGIMATEAIPLGSKPRFEILDGLCGVAAMIVVAFHLFETYSAGPREQILNHGYLAVDFFFVLSGFVIGYAYDDRWGRMTTWDFFKRRLIRLQIPRTYLITTLHHALSHDLCADELGGTASGRTLRHSHMGGCEHLYRIDSRSLRLRESLRPACARLALGTVHS